MRYYYEKPDHYERGYGQHYICKDAYYRDGTLFLRDDKGLVVIQERYSQMSKSFWWGKIDEWLAYDIYHHDHFWFVFERFAEEASEDGTYPVISVRKMMWELRMKPLRKEWWEES